jgi:deazaflavin-dependent oxidoreductase (nitroreductase family)
VPAPRWLARVNKHATNHVTAPFAARLPGFGIVVHRGRRSGREYRTPVNVFRIDGGYSLALTYGRDAQWVRNVLAAGGCDLVWRGRTLRLGDPEVVHDERRRDVPAPVGAILGVLHVDDFLHLRPR